MQLLAHHAGEQSLVSLWVLLGGGGLSLMVAVTWARVAATWDRLTKRQDSRRRG
jgi:hypothetical protein